MTCSLLEAFNCLGSSCTRVQERCTHLIRIRVSFDVSYEPSIGPVGAGELTQNVTPIMKTSDRMLITLPFDLSVSGAALNARAWPRFRVWGEIAVQIPKLSTKVTLTELTSATEPVSSLRRGPTKDDVVFNLPATVKGSVLTPIGRESPKSARTTVCGSAESGFSVRRKFLP